MTPSMVDRRDVFWLRLALAFIWLATGASVVFPAYQQVGRAYLLHLRLDTLMSDRVMGATCLFEVLLGLRLLLGPAGTWMALLQAAMIVGFTVILAIVEPALLWSPFGMLTKNVPLLALVGTVWMVEGNGWTPGALWLLRGGMASIWLLEGLLPALLFQSETLREVLESNGLAWIDPGVELRIIAVLQILSAVAVLVLRGWPLRLLLGCHIVGLVAICVLIGRYDNAMLVHPFGPVTKNVSILIGTVVVLRRVSLPVTPGAKDPAHQ